jgi:hypothetical protein
MLMAETAHLNRDDHLPFDVREFARTVQGSRRDSLPYAWLAEHPFGNTSLRQMRYMALAERHTMHHMRNLLVTPSHKDAYVTAFLTSWAFEKYWAADALIAVLEANGVGPEETRLPAGRTDGGRLTAALDRLVPIRNSVAANVIGEDFIAIHMTWGLIEERLAQIAYESMLTAAHDGGGTPDGATAERAAGAAELFGPLISQKDRHLRFYSRQAGLHLGRSAKARWLTRTGISRSWIPLSFAGQPRFETLRSLAPLLETPAATEKIARLDDDLAALPGMEGTPWASDALAKLGVAPASRGRR